MGFFNHQSEEAKQYEGSLKEVHYNHGVANFQKTKVRYERYFQG